MVDLFVWEEDERVVHINDEPSFCNHVPEGIVHEPLEHCKELVSPKNITVGLKRPLCMMKAAFHWCQAIFDADIVIAPADIKFGEKFGVFELVNEVGDKQERIGISSGVFI